MNCINDELIQKYIDREVNEKEVVYIEQHISNCSSCSVRIETQKKMSDSFKSAINLIVDDKNSIPAFRSDTQPVTKLKVSRRRIVYVASTIFVAACLTLFILVFTNEPTTRTQEHISFFNAIDYEADANQPASQQPLRIHVIDPDGNRIDFILE